MLETWVYLGACAGNKKGEKWYQYQRIDPQGEGQPLYYGKRLADCQPGWQITLEVTESAEKRTVKIDTVKIIGPYGDSEYRQRLQAQSRAFEYSLELEKSARQPEYLKALDPLRAAYQKTNSAGKRKLLAEIIEYISR